MILSCTGHRPKDLDNDYTYKSDLSKKIMEEMKKLFYSMIHHYEDNNLTAISGMALGVDTMWAMVAIELNIPLIAAIPFEGQELKWPDKSKELYYRILLKTIRKEYISPPGYAANKMQIRNEWMVNNSDILVAVYNGNLFGGTYNCINYAIKKEKPIIYLNYK